MNQIIQPTYYDTFSCTAADCPYNCCKEWKIAVDADTKKQWKAMRCPEEMHSKKAHLANYVTSKGITLCEDGRCPFLNDGGLCHIVSTYGEEALSVTCHTFPREVHDLKTRTELTLSTCCPAVLDLLWKNVGFKKISSASLENARTDSPAEPASPLLDLRDFCQQQMADTDTTPEEVLKTIFYILLDYNELEEPWERKLQTLPENYAEVLQAIRSLPVDDAETAKEQREVFLDIIDQYLQKGIYIEFLTPLAKLAMSTSTEPDSSFDTVFQALLPKIRTLLEEEIYSTLVLEESDLYSVTMKWQWIAMVYTSIKQALYLSWIFQGRPDKIPYETLRDCVMFMMRITGYSEADIEDYLCSSFEEVIWPWGYMALLVG